MHELQLLHNALSKVCLLIYNNCLSCLMKAMNSLLLGKKLTLVNIGRHLCEDSSIKNKIKQSDCLIGNANLYDDRILIYQSLCHLLISLKSRPIILVDWSVVTYCGAHHMIRASIPLDGRTFTIYEEVHPESERDSPKSNKLFLNNLAKILLTGCRPIIVTDAGFRNPWFNHVLKMG